MGHSLILRLLLSPALAGDGNDLPVGNGPQTGQSIRVSSEAHFSEEEARLETNARLNDRLVERLAAQSAWRVPDGQLRRYLPQLLAKPDVNLQKSTEMIEKPYGTMYRRHLAVTLPDETLDSWISQVIHAGQTRRRLRACAALATSVGWLSGLMMIVKLDRWTRGYHRRTILLGALAFLVCATCVGWMMLLG